MKSIVVTVVLFAACTLASKVSYEGFSIYRLTPHSNEAIVALQKLEKAPSSGYNFFTPVKSIGQSVDVLVPPNLKADIKKLTKNINIDIQIVVNNLQEKINDESLRQQSIGEENFGWTSYQEIEPMYMWLKAMSDLYPKIATLLRVGPTYENRTMVGIKLSFKEGNQNRSVFIDSNIHAREWITSAVSTYIINELIFSDDTSVRDIAESYDWYIFPVINPDGFVYTHTTDRMWRKTRVPYANGCYGADPNRNWDVLSVNGGASNEPCSETYCGPEPFSEPSMRNLAKYMSTIAHTLVGYISFHSYSQVLMVPYGNTSAILDNYNVTYPIGLKAAETLAKRYGTKYNVGTIHDVMYQTSGTSMDYVKAKYQIPFAYTYELRDTGTCGFILPADQIIPTAQETLDSLVTIFTEAKKYL